MCRIPQELFSELVATTSYSEEFCSSLKRCCADTKSVNTKVLIKGEKVELATQLDEAFGACKEANAAMKAYRTWQKARIDGKLKRSGYSTKSPEAALLDAIRKAQGMQVGRMDKRIKVSSQL